MPAAQINGVQIHYREAGEGYPVFLLHGFTGNLRNWALQIPVLTEDFRTVSLDHRGHGHSEKPTRPEDYTLELMARDAAGVLAHLGIDQCYVVGHSMGGMVAQHLVLDHPELVRALVLVDTAAEVPQALRVRERLRERGRLVRIAREKGMEAVFEEQLRASPQREQMLANPQFLEIYRQQFLLTSTDAYIHGAHGMASHRSLLDKLGAISAPTLIICGEDDEPFLDPSRQMNERISGSEMAVIPSAGHTPQIERPAEFNHVLMDFLTRVRREVAAGG